MLTFAEMKPRPPVKREDDDGIDWGLTVGWIVVSGGCLLVVALLAVGLVALSRRASRKAEEDRLRFEREQLAIDTERAAREDQRRAALMAQHGAAAAARIMAEEEARRRRLDDLTRRFGPDVTARILRREIWQGQTADMLTESMGPPGDVDEKVMAKKVRHVFKYHRQAANKYGLRVTLDDGRVVGWDDKR